MNERGSELVERDSIRSDQKAFNSLKLCVLRHIVVNLKGSAVKFKNRASNRADMCSQRYRLTKNYLQSSLIFHKFNYYS